MLHNAIEKAHLEESRDAIIGMTGEGKVLYWSKGAEATFGYSRMEAEGRDLVELVVPGDRIEEERRIVAEAREKGIATYESTRCRKDGTLVYVNITDKAVRSATGELELLLSIKKDVTPLRLSRDATMLETCFRDLIESIPDAILMVNPIGRIVLANAQAEQLFGYRRGDLSGKPVEELLPERYRTLHLKYRAGFFDQPRMRTLHPELEFVGLRADGTEFPVEISLSPLHTEAGALVMSAIRDVSRRRKADQEFRALLESAPDAIVIVDSAGHMVLINSQTEKLFGYARAELLEKPVELLLPLHDRESHSRRRGRFFADPRVRPMGVGLELCGRRKDGTEFPVEISLSPLQTEQGMLVSSAIRDITERKRFEKALQEKNIELADANVAKDIFWAHMSHELRTPLNAIIGFTGALLMKLPGPLNADQEKHLSAMQSDAKQLLALINDLLDGTQM